MKGITIGPAGGHGLSRMQGTKVMLAGRTAFLPNDDVPFVFQRLTAGQINAIPRDRFSVALIEVPTRMGMAGPGKKGRGGIAVKGLQRMKGLSRTGGGITGFVRKPSGTIKVEVDGTKQYTAMITLAKQVIQTADDMYYVNRRLSRNSGGGPPSESALFYEPIDEGRLSDCFMKIIADYFGDGDKCKLYGHDFKLHEFCLFVHYYFRRIGIMKTNARQPFSEYVRKSVLKDGAAFTDKTFNNVAKLYEDEEKEFTDKKMHEINFDFRPSKDAKSNKPLQQLLYAFQDIGYNFHNSDYFKYLRDTRKRMNDFYL